VLGLGVALLPGAPPATSFFEKLAKTMASGVGNAEARRLQDFPHGMFNLFLMCGTIL